MYLELYVLETIVATLILYTLYGAVYRLYLSPVAKFPGRKLAALTFWYEYYYDAVEGGRYVWEIEKMHQEFGPIVRINPYELHVVSNDPVFMNQLYPTVGRTVDKWWWSARMFGSTEMTFGTPPHNLHRRRRAAFSQSFSKASVRRLEPMLQGMVDSLCEGIEKGLAAGRIVNLVHAYSALTQDVITEYCFADCRSVLEMEDFAPHYYNFLQDSCRLTPVMKQIPWLVPMLNKLPDWLIKIIHQPTAYFREQLSDYAAAIHRITSSESSEQPPHLTVFHALRDNPELPMEEKSPARLTAEATSLVGAGTLTSVYMLAITSYHILANSKVLENLLSELEKAIPDASIPLGLQGLEKLPYLNAVINEGLRVSYGVLHRLTRVHPDAPLQFEQWTIPPGTPVGMSPVFLHNDKNMFPRHRNFEPEWWIDVPKEPREAMLKRLSNFGHGSRQCAGMNLAYAELYLAISTVFRRLGLQMQLHDTDRVRDVDMVNDYFIPAPSTETRGVRVKAIGWNSRLLAPTI